jgi:hypothetical protein
VDAFLVGFVLGILGGDALPDGPAFNVVLLVAVVLYETVLLTIAAGQWARCCSGCGSSGSTARRWPPRDALIRSAVIDAIGVIPLGWVLAAIVLEKHRLRQGWHDRAAGTLVVSTRRTA